MKTSHHIALSIIISAGLIVSSCSQKKEDATSPETITEQVESTDIKTNEQGSYVPDTSGKLQAISEEEFIKYITEINNPKGFQYKGSIPCIVDFYADWCRPCHALNPILIELGEKYKGQIIIYKLNVDRAVNVSEAFGVKSIPTLIFFKPQSMPSKMEGAPAKEELEKAISDLLLTK